jgi:glycosyltransferase involved in cell wall biosynthesis
MKKVLISSFDMEVGGVERSLISMLENFDYKHYDVDLMLYKHQGEFMNLLSPKVNLLEEISEYATFRQSVTQILRSKQINIGLSRVLSKYKAQMISKKKGFQEPGYLQMQLMWKLALPFLPKIRKEYDVAISYLWPHYFVAEKVNAKKKIAWIHTDYSTIDTDINLDIKMWDKFDYIVAVSEACKEAFINKYKELTKKVVVIENINSPEFIKTMAEHSDDNPLLEDKRFKIVTVARLSHAKGIDNAVRALKLLKDKGYNDLAWYVIGYGGDELKIKILINDLGLEGSFFLLGKKTNPYPYIKESDMYVQPSRYEGKAVTVTEAQILEKPVLITNYTTASSQINNGIDGVICDLSVEGIANGVESLVNDKKQRIKLANNIRGINYGNKNELKKLYELIS